MDAQRPKMAEILRPAQVGSAEIDHFTITPKTWTGFGVHIRPGTYARLKIGGDTYMSDTDDEWRSNIGFVLNARGRVLVSGLGIGFTLIPVLRKADVTHVTVLEKHADVVALVEPQLRAYLRLAEVDFSRTSVRDRLNAKLTVVCADAYEWTPPQVHPLKYDAIYHDIWADQSTDALADMTKLKRRYAHRLAPGGWQRCWNEDVLRYRLRQERRAGW